MGSPGLGGRGGESENDTQEVRATNLDGRITPVGGPVGSTLM